MVSGQLLQKLPLEDRGRILEYLYAGEEGLRPGLSRNPHPGQGPVPVRGDPRLLPSCAGADRLPWETLVDPVPFSRYQEAVMTFQPLAKG